MTVTMSVYAELQVYSKLVMPGGILIVADTTFEDLADTPVVTPSEKYPDAKRSNPRVALRRFLSECSDFLVVPDYHCHGDQQFSRQRTLEGWLKRIG